MYYYDPTYILVIIGTIISLLASMHVKSAFARYDRIGARSGITAQEAARRILNEAGIFDVSIETVPGSLSDHYSPKEKVLRLSGSVYGHTSIAAISVAAHECGHAIQHNENYSMLSLRSLSVPAANFGSYLSWPLILLGLWLGYMNLVTIGIVLFLFVVIFQVITLPVEFNASARALRILESSRMLDDSEMRGAKKVLSAAALTYVAAVVSALLQLLRLVLLANKRRK